MLGDQYSDQGREAAGVSADENVDEAAEGKDQQLGHRVVLRQGSKSVPKQGQVQRQKQSKGVPAEGQQTQKPKARVRPAVDGGGELQQTNTSISSEKVEKIIQIGETLITFLQEQVKAKQKQQELKEQERMRKEQEASQQLTQMLQTTQQKDEQNKSLKQHVEQLE